MRRVILSALTGLVVAACAKTLQFSDADIETLRWATKTPLTCETSAQCDLMWGRALRWIPAGSPHRVTIADE